LIDVEKWNKVFGENSNIIIQDKPSKFIGSYIAYVKELIKKFNLQSEEVFKKMNINKNSPPLDMSSLKEKFKYFNSLLTQSKIEKLCKELLRGKDQIEVKELAEILFPISSNYELKNFI